MGIAGDILALECMREYIRSDTFGIIKRFLMTAFFTGEKQILFIYIDFFEFEAPAFYYHLIQDIYAAPFSFCFLWVSLP